jgi:uncharacterized integral membrane protein
MMLTQHLDLIVTAVAAFVMGYITGRLTEVLRQARARHRAMRLMHDIANRRADL